MDKNNDPRQEGHTREWQDRARVVLDAKENVKHNASPNQSPRPEETEDVEEKSKHLDQSGKDDAVY